MQRKFMFKEWFFLWLSVTLLSFSLSSYATSSSSSSSLALSNHLFNHEIHDIEGAVEIRAIIYKNQNKKNKESVQYLLQTKSGLTYTLTFIDNPPAWFKTGAIIRIKTALLRELIDGQKELLTSSRELILIKTVALTAIPESLGQQKTIVMLINFRDKPNERPYTKEEVQRIVFTDVKNNYLESSYGQTTLVGDVIGYFTLPIAGANCATATNAIPQLAAAAASNAGIDLSSYKRRVYIFPNNYNCGWGGLGTIGGSPSHSWINGFASPAIVAHELGHNLGLYHSHSLTCPNSPNQGSCTMIEYGDGADTMGNSGTPFHFNTFQKERLGWLNYQISPPILSVTRSGTYTISPLETNVRNTKALKILKRNLPDGSHDYYYLEFRQGIGYDTELATCRDCDFTKGVLFHQGNDVDPNTSNLLDMSPSDGNSRFMALLPGRSFSDTATGVSFTVNSISSAEANVTIPLGSVPPPPPPNPGNYDYVYPTNISSYKAGTKVLGADNKIYQCKAYPASGWCSQSPLYYEPGKGIAWQMAWDLIS